MQSDWLHITFSASSWWIMIMPLTAYLFLQPIPLERVVENCGRARSLGTMNLACHSVEAVVHPHSLWSNARQNINVNHWVINLKRELQKNEVQTSQNSFCTYYHSYSSYNSNSGNINAVSFLFLTAYMLNISNSSQETLEFTPNFLQDYFLWTKIYNYNRFC